MPLLSFQKPAVAACIAHIYDSKKITWNGLQIAPPTGIDASVSSGKSIMIAELAAAMKAASESKGKRSRIMVLQRQTELMKQNSEAAWGIGLENSMYSAAKKSTYFDVIYATEGTIARALDREFATWTPDLLLIDECHQVPFDEPDSQFMRIIAHFYRAKPYMRVIGFSGSWFRGAESIIGDFWQKSLTLEPTAANYPEGGQGNGQISTEWMIANGWVVQPIFGWPEHEDEDSYEKEFASLQTNAGSWEFSEKELDEATADLDKLRRILAEVIVKSRERKGVLIFGATLKHLGQIERIMRELGVPADQIGAITEGTSDKERASILDRARDGKCKYVLNVGVLTTGVNCPWWDTLVYLRPIGSLVLLIQSIGRVLRLLLEEGGPGMVEMDAMTTEERLALIAASPKPNALVLDYAGVMGRLGALYENPILEQAQKEHSARKGDLIECPACAEMNSMYARRCIGMVGSQRCEHFFQFKKCPDCQTKNDIVARACRCCGRQLIDPNEPLTGKHYTEAELVPVVSMKLTAGSGGKLMVRYVLSDGREPMLVFYPNAGRNDQSIKVNTKVWWNGMVVPHIPPGPFRNQAYRMKAETAAKNAAIFNVPTHVAARFNEKTGKWVIGRRRFRSGSEVEVIEQDSEVVE